MGAGGRGLCDVCKGKKQNPAIGGVVMYTNPDVNGVRRAYTIELCGYHWDRIFTFLRYMGGGDEWHEAEEQHGQADPAVDVPEP